ncbi:hypothetical protein [Allomesorhizobium camelthorni]|uniref:Uncharacterized protein n=1 Tax=Allomesorhizobium camelthorni TaxID=475069 RepID=A0A6G4W7J5_9HYPH|nr:hypothetical protein [Mesorhizobium camelthorni]NGO50298.1 hypothetical protein [Mesorhizobium camelthorni]
MSDLFLSTEFWFGAAVLGAYQFAKFSELSSLDPEFAARSATIPNLRAIDFAGRVTYCATLVAFLVATFLIYFVLCKVSPTILLGWAQVSGAQLDEELKKFVDTVNYPLYIAAAYIGFTQPGIPFLSNIGNVQRNMFHAWMGVPSRVMSTSSFFATQIFTRCQDTKQLAKELQILVGDAFVQRIEAYADADFYRAHLARLKLDDAAELLKGTRRELKILTRQLVDVASLATVRESGVASLSRLAGDLRVSMLPNSGWSNAFLAGGTLFLIGMTFLWNLIPVFDSTAERFLSAGSEYDFWPNNLRFSGQYLISQAGPIFLAIGVALATWVSAFGRAQMVAVDEPQPVAGMADHFSRYAGLLAFTVIAIVLFDIFQAFFDYGAYGLGKTTEFVALVQVSLPFYLLHSFVSLVVCFVLLRYMDDRTQPPRWRAASTISLLVAGVALASLFYAAAQVQHKFDAPFGPNGADLAVLMVVINVSAALMAFVCAALCKRQAETSPNGPRRQDLPRTPVTEFAGGRVDAPLAPAVPTGE